MISVGWMGDAACAWEDPELWFPVNGAEEGDPSRVKQEDAAKAICRVCPVRDECLAYALNGGPSTDYGVWGGLDERERRTLKRHRARAAA